MGRFKKPMWNLHWRLAFQFAGVLCLLCVGKQWLIVSCRCPFAIRLSWSHKPLCTNHWMDENTSMEVARDVCTGQACQLSANGETILSAARNAWRRLYYREWAEALPDVTVSIISHVPLKQKEHRHIPDWLIVESDSVSVNMAVIISEHTP